MSNANQALVSMWKVIYGQTLNALFEASMKEFSETNEKWGKIKKHATASRKLTMKVDFLRKKLKLSRWAFRKPKGQKWKAYFGASFGEKKSLQETRSSERIEIMLLFRGGPSCLFNESTQTKSFLCWNKKMDLAHFVLNGSFIYAHASLHLAHSVHISLISMELRYSLWRWTHILALLFPPLYIPDLW